MFFQHSFFYAFNLSLLHLFILAGLVALNSKLLRTCLLQICVICNFAKNIVFSAYMIHVFHHGNRWIKPQFLEMPWNT